MRHLLTSQQVLWLLTSERQLLQQQHLYTVRLPGPWGHMSRQCWSKRSRTCVCLEYPTFSFHSAPHTCLNSIALKV